MHKIGIDLGGTKTEAILLDEAFNVLERKRISTPKNGGYESIINSILSLVTSLRKSRQDVTIGVCTPGVISTKTGLIKNSNTQCLIGRPLKEDLEKSLDQEITIENDANCFCLAESTFGAAKNYDVVFGIILGTGVGGGIVIDGKIHRGRTYIAGEWGHHTLWPNGNTCYCGNKGCVETYLSGPALEKRWSELTGKTESLETITQNIKGEKEKKWKKEFLENFGISVANVIDILDPDAVVIGGGVSNIPFLYDEGRDAVYQKVFTDSIDTPIFKNKLGDSAGVFGACLI